MNRFDPPHRVQFLDPRIVGAVAKVTIRLLGPAIGTEHVNRRNITKVFGNCGEALNCVTCLKLRNMDANAIYPMSTMEGLVRVMEEAD